MSKQKTTKPTPAPAPKKKAPPKPAPARSASKPRPPAPAKAPAPKPSPMAKPAPPAAAKPVGVAKSASLPRPAAQPVQAGKATKPAPTPVKGGKTAYTRAELEHFRKIILEKKKEILEELETLRDSMLDVTTGEYASESSMYSTHMEQGTDAMEREKTFLFASREGKFLNHLEDALQRIDRGEYGKCSECGKLIEKERLEAVPHAQQCLQCKMNLSK